MSCLTIKNKSDAPSALQRFINLAETQTGHRVKLLGTDRGGEFLGSSLSKWLGDKGIQHVMTPSDAHSQNGRVERAHLTLPNDMRTLLIDSGLPEQFWAEAIAYASYNRNNFMVNKEGKIPVDLCTGQQASLRHLQPFGQRLFYRVHQQQSKLLPRYLPGRLMGYQAGSTSYRVYNPTTRQSVATRDMVIQEVEPAPSTDWNLTITNPSVGEEHASQEEDAPPPASKEDHQEVEEEEATKANEERWIGEQERLDRIKDIPEQELSVEDQSLKRRWRNSNF